MTDTAGHAEPPPETILFVEDETLIRMDMAEFLRQCGYRVAEVGSAAEAVEALQAKLTIDLVITDIKMPGEMDGEALAKWIEEKRPGVKVILTSAHRPSDDKGDRLYLTKPYTGRALLGLVRAALGDPDCSPQN